MEITINGNVTINQNQGTGDRQPIDRTNEVLIDNVTTFEGLIRILQGRPEAVEAAETEAEEKEREARHEQMKKAYKEEGFSDTEDTEDEDGLVKAKRRPGASFLRKYEPRIAMSEIGEDGLCEVFVNGYAVYDNGNRKTVVWVPDCGSTTYYFGPLKDNEKEYLNQSEDIGEDVMGKLPWYMPLLIAGEDSIERNLIHPKTSSNSNDKSWEEEADIKAAKKWAGGYRFDNPEEAYLRKEEQEEIHKEVKKLRETQRDAIEMYYFHDMDQKQMSKEMGISQPSVNSRLKYGKKELEDPLRKFL